MKISIDSGENFQETSHDVRVSYTAVDRDELQITLNDEGMVLDVWHDDAALTGTAWFTIDDLIKLAVKNMKVVNENG